MAIALKAGKHTSARTASRLRRQVRGRKKVAGTAERPRLVVTRSTKHITVQVVDDVVGKTIARNAQPVVQLDRGDDPSTLSATSRTRSVQVMRMTAAPSTTQPAVAIQPRIVGAIQPARAPNAPSSV